jgi:prepilin-type N-terminal cleavage/methylation domain-containing protein
MTDTTINQLKPENKAGFTLIELSIVLVIIGLLVGGILVGQDLIKASEIRATVGQYEKYNTAINTFRTKYNGIPGDLLASNAGAFGLPCAGTTTACSTGVTGMGTGDGLVGDPSGTGAQLGDPLFFWAQLTSANLIDGSLGQSPNITLTTGAAAVTTPISFFPPAKLGKGNYWMVGTASGQNYYLLGLPTSISTSDVTLTASSGLTPIDAFNIDTKIDDGLPITGVVQARGTATTGVAIFPDYVAGNIPSVSAAGTAAACVTGNATATTATNTYNRSTYGTTPACALRLRFN